MHSNISIKKSLNMLWVCRGKVGLILAFMIYCDNKQLSDCERGIFHDTLEMSFFYVRATDRMTAKFKAGMLLGKFISLN